MRIRNTCNLLAGQQWCGRLLTGFLGTEVFVARIPETELERLKREVAIERLAQARGVELTPHGANLLGLCPFHDDHEPSFVVTPAKNLWHCLGACQAGGSVVDFVMRAECVSFRYAVELLRAELGEATGRGDDAPAKKLPAVVTLDADDRALLRDVVGYYHQTLTESPEALAYLEQRGLHSSEMTRRFQLGFANRTLTYRLPARGRTELRERLERLGILRESGHEHFNGCVVIPVIDEHGEVTEIYGRKITSGLRKGTPLHLYLPGPHRGVWNVEALAASKEIILCEALIDALTFWCAGFRNVTTSYGVEGFTEDHLTAFRRHGTERVLIAYDRDTAGDGAAEKLAERLTAAGIESLRVQFPKGMDANAYALKVAPAAKSLSVLLRHAQWIGKGATPVLSPDQGPARLLPSEPTIAAPAAAAQVVVEPATVPEPAVLPAAPKQPSPLAADPSQSSAPPATEILTEVKPEEIVIRLGDRKYRVRGLAKNLSYEQLRVNVLCARGESFHVDTFDLYAARQRALFIKQAAEELGLKEDVIKKDLGTVLLKLEALQDEQIRHTLEPEEKTVVLSDAEQAAALDLLKDPHLLDRILVDFERCGVVGEETNKLVGYLAAVSRKLDEPLAVLIQSSSAAGKTALMEAILAFMPEEERVKYSAMTGQSLFYLGETDLRHKILALVEEEGAQRASYALKLLQSEGELTIASTGKDPTTGKLVTHEYRVEGPVMIVLTTTAVEIDDELLNRCLVLTVDEDRAQTRAIHRRQRERQTLEGLLADHERERTLAVHRNAQRLLRPLLVANPYARALTFLDTRTRTRRDHQKYLTLIRAIALLHQYQRPVQTTVQQGETLAYIEVTRADIRLANRLAHEVLGRSLDELAPQTRRLLGLLDHMVAEACTRLAMDRADYRFSRKDVRDATGWGHTQLKVHLHRLEELEYLLVHRGGRGQSFVYELLYRGEGQDGGGFVMGLVDPEQLDGEYDGKKSGVFTNRSGPEAEKSGSSRPQVGAKSGGGRGAESATNALSDKGFGDSAAESPENALFRAPAAAPPS
jgi:DNA primase